MRKPGGKNANGMSNREQQVSVIAQVNLKLAIFLFCHSHICTLDWEITAVNEDTVHLMKGQKKLKDEYKDPNMLPKIKKSDMTGMMEGTEDYFRLCHGVMWAPLAYVIRKTIAVQTYSDYLTYATPDGEMITRMLNLPLEKNMLLHETATQTV